MKKSLIEFLERITEESFTEWIDDSFNMYAASGGVNGHVELGNIGNGDFAVRFNNRKDIYVFVNMAGAIEFFKTKLTSLEEEGIKYLKYKIEVK